MTKIKNVWIPILGLFLGMFIGLQVSPEIPGTYAGYYISVVIILIDTILGGIKASLQNAFDLLTFWAGMISNLAAAFLLVYLGGSLELDLYLVVVFAFGCRIFQNVSAVRGIILRNYKSETAQKRKK